MTGTEILDRAIAEELATPKFNRREPRISSIGLCARRQVAYALGLVENDIPWEYGEAGHLLEKAAFWRIKKYYPDALNDVWVETWIPGVWCHPDIIIPSLGHAIQVKSAMASSSTWGQKKRHQVDQFLGEWLAWNTRKEYWLPILTATFERRQYKKSIKMSRVIELVGPFSFCPRSYEILVLDRESYSRVRLSLPVRYDQRRARELEAKFWEVARCIEFETLPSRPSTRGFECYDCQLRKECWE